MTVLSVNLNKIALLRNSRGDDLPSVEQAARTCIASGCGGITLHPRPDQRHARPEDCRSLKSWLPVELNLEGNPFEGSRGSYPGFVELVLEVMPAQCTLVPDASDQLTSDHGFDLARDAQRLAPIIARLRSAGIRVSLFMDAGVTDFSAAAAIGAHRIEIYTGPYAKAFAAGDAGHELALISATVQAANAVGLGVNAGHDLDQRNLATLLRAAPLIEEVSIGHALIAEALYAGLAPTVQAYLDAIRSSHSS